MRKSTFYRWQSLYSGMKVPELARMKKLKKDSQRLKQMFADLSLKNRALKKIIEKILTPTEKRNLVDFAKATVGLSTRATCRAVCLIHTVYHYQSGQAKDNPII